MLLREFLSNDDEAEKATIEKETGDLAEDEEIEEDTAIETC